MIDFHNHVLPKADDGSQSLEMSLNMLKEAEKQGITDVVNTIHFQHPKMININTSYNYIKSEIRKLEENLEKHNVKVKIHPGAEVFFNFNLTQILDNPITTIGSGKYMLIEFQTLSFPKNYQNEIFNLQTKNVTPIIAHPERYRPIQNDLSILKSWIEKGYIIQLDCGSLLNHFGEKAKSCAYKIIQKGLYHLVGSDAHNDKKRNFCLSDSLDIIEKEVSINDSNIIRNNLNMILRGEECIKCNGIKKKKKSSFFSFFK